MFTWICPQCGKEVPPSYSDCPACAERRQQAAVAQPPQPPAQMQPPVAPQYPPQQSYPAAAPPPPAYPPQQPPPPQPQYAQPVYPPPPQQQYAPQQPVYQQPQAPVYTIADHKKGMPAWLAAVLTIVALGVVLYGAYKFLGKGSPSSTTETKAAAQKGAPATGPVHPYQKYIEVVGVRLIEGANKKPVIRYTVVNHSGAELAGLELKLTVTTDEAKPGDPPITVVDSKVGSIPPYGVKDVEAPLDTKLKVYELPDWQFVRTSFEITAPK
jgi:hypothetical protein